MAKALQPRMSVRMRSILMLIAIACTTLIAFGTCLVFIHASNKTIQVPITAAPVFQGEEIKADKIAMKEIGTYGLPTNMATKESQVVGKYAIRDFGKDEFFFGSSLTSDYYKRLAQKAKYGAIAISTNLIQSVNAEVKENDFVKIMLVLGRGDKGGNNNGSANDFKTDSYYQDGAKLVVPKELEAVRVLGLYSGDAKSVEWNKDQLTKAAPDKQVEKEGTVAPSMIIFDARPVQQALLASVQYNGSIHMVVLPESVQQQYRERWGINADGSVVDRGVSEDTLSKELDEVGKKTGNTLGDVDPEKVLKDAPKEDKKQ